MQSMQTGNGEIAGEIRAVRRQKHRRALDVFLLDRCDLVRDWQGKKCGRSITGFVGSALSGSSATSYSLILGSFSAARLCKWPVISSRGGKAFSAAYSFPR